MSQFNDWEVPYSCIRFFEDSLNGQSKVVSVSRTDDIYFVIIDTKGRRFKVVLVNEYVLGLSAVLEIKRQFSEVEHIVTAGSWNGYTREAKEYGWKNDIGIFNVSEFFGALNWTKPITYYTKDHNGNKQYAFKSA